MVLQRVPDGGKEARPYIPTLVSHWLKAALRDWASPWAEAATFPQRPQTIPSEGRSYETPVADIPAAGNGCVGPEGGPRELLLYLL